MAPRGMITMMTVLLCLILSLLSPAQAALGSRMGKACCTRYTKKPVPFNRIKGYREQTAIENCRIEAIIFYTKQNIEICATRKDAWVRKTLELLSSKLKKMSNAGSAAEETQTRKSVNPSTFNNGGEASYSPTESSPNSTDTFY